MVNMYHDTMPPQPGAVKWPGVPPFAIPDEATLDFADRGRLPAVRHPDEVLEQIAKYQEVGCDQLVFGIPNEGFEHDEVLEMIELFGTKVIPEFDKDPESPHHPLPPHRQAQVPRLRPPAARGPRRQRHPHQRPAPAGG
jgi:hypothetical protein